MESEQGALTLYNWARSLRLVPAVLLHNLTICSHLFLFLKLRDPNQQIEECIKNESIEQVKKHFHKRFVNIKALEFAIKIHALMGPCTLSVCVCLKWQLLVNNCSQIFVLLHCLSSLTMNVHR